MTSNKKKKKKNKKPILLLGGGVLVVTTGIWATLAFSMQSAGTGTESSYNPYEIPGAENEEDGAMISLGEGVKVAGTEDKEKHDALKALEDAESEGEDDEKKKDKKKEPPKELSDDGWGDDTSNTFSGLYNFEEFSNKKFNKQRKNFIKNMEKKNQDVREVLQGADDDFFSLSPSNEKEEMTILDYRRKLNQLSTISLDFDKQNVPINELDKSVDREIIYNLAREIPEKEVVLPFLFRMHQSGLIRMIQYKASIVPVITNYDKQIELGDITEYTGDDKHKFTGTYGNDIELYQQLFYVDGNPLVAIIIEFKEEYGHSAALYSIHRITDKNDFGYTERSEPALSYQTANYWLKQEKKYSQGNFY